MSSTYGWRGGPAPDIDIQKAGEYIEGLGSVEAKDLVEKAKSKRSPLHNYFLWDDSEAASEYRLVQARVLLASVVVIPADKTIAPTRAFVGVTHEPKTYVPTHVAMSDEEMRAQVLAQAFADYRRWESRYRELSELAAIFAAAAQAFSITAA